MMIEGSISEWDPHGAQTGFKCESLIDGLLRDVCVCVWMMKKRMEVHTCMLAIEHRRHYTNSLSCPSIRIYKFRHSWGEKCLVDHTPLLNRPGQAVREDTHSNINNNNNIYFQNVKKGELKWNWGRGWRTSYFFHFEKLHCFAVVIASFLVKSHFSLIFSLP